MGTAKGLTEWAHGGMIGSKRNTKIEKTDKIKKRKIKQGKLPENIANRDIMAELAKFRKAGKTRAGGIVQNLGSAKGLIEWAHGGMIGSKRNPKIEKRTKLKSENKTGKIARKHSKS